MARTITTKGVLRFDGLKDGTYTIKEVLAPTGYKKLDEDITLVVTLVRNCGRKTATIGRMR